MNKTPFVLIMAGGVGSRFWPASRESLPKQFLDITGSGKTLIHQTFERFASFIPIDQIYVITHILYKSLTQEAIPGIHPDNIITEPSRNNTAASIALATLKLKKINPEAICIVAPADHIIADDNEFQKTILAACYHTSSFNSIVTLSIKPTRPDTGYGYIEFDPEDISGIRKVKSFKEKPNPGDALRYLKAGNFAWNAGIFIWRLNVILDAFRNHAPQIFNVLSTGNEVYNTEKEDDFVNKEYPRTDKISVDYAILEKADNVYTIPCDIGWSDLGTWNSLYDISPKDAQQNAPLSKPVYLEGTNNSLVFSKNSKLIVIKGLEDFIIVDTDDCLLIYPKSEEQAIKALKELLRERGLDDYL